MPDRSGPADLAVARAARRLCADYRWYIESQWPTEAEGLLPSQLALCTTELGLIVKTLAAVVDRIAAQAAGTAPSELRPFETAFGPDTAWVDVPAGLAALSDDARAVYLAALRLDRARP